MTQERQDTRAALAERLAEMAQRYAKAGGHWDVVKDLQDAVALLTASDAREPQPAEHSRIREALEDAWHRGWNRRQANAGLKPEPVSGVLAQREADVTAVLAALSPSPTTEPVCPECGVCGSLLVCPTCEAEECARQRAAYLWAWYANRADGGEDWRCLRCRGMVTVFGDAVKRCPKCDTTEQEPGA
jgi:hypothetical protein